MIAFTLIILLSLVSQMFLPWWTCVIVSFAISAFFCKHAGKAFLTGFSAVFLLWISMALIIHVSNDFILGERIATMLSLPSSHLLPLISGLIGGLSGGIGAWAGKLSGDLIKNF